MVGGSLNINRPLGKALPWDLLYEMCAQNKTRPIVKGVAYYSPVQARSSCS